MAPTSLPADIARMILDGFDRHYRLFRETSAGAQGRFERGEWSEVARASRDRIAFYDQRVAEAVENIKARFPRAGQDESLWPDIKLSYIGLLYEHRQPDLAETFFNSVACRVLHRKYYRNEYIFWRPAMSTEHLHGSGPSYRSFYPHEASLGPAVRDALLSFGLSCPWEDLDRDVDFICRGIDEHFPKKWVRHPNFQFQVLASLFFRNKGAYLVGKAINGSVETPFVVPILRREDGRVFADAVCLSPESIGRIFSLARAYFMVDMEVPAAYVKFLRSVMLSKSAADLYTVVGLQKQGKTLLYRELHEHLMHSTDAFVIAPGTRGMVMLVFTLPSFPYVFKIIRDWFDPPKDVDAAQVRDRYQLVKNHDRVGRLADTLEYSDVGFPKARFSPELLAKIERIAPSKVEHDGDRIVVKHLWVERRMVPLDVYVRSANDAQLEAVIKEYGNAVRELAGANIFPGDLLLKNFGVTRYGRVVFYDYDELGYLTDYRFRRMPTATSDEDETRSHDWVSVSENDIFPEQFPTFLLPEGKPRDLFLKHHADLADPAFWISTQEALRAGVQRDVFPYRIETRFVNRYGQ